ncbi:MAG: sigma-70 family RNA polymerase sigma factor [Acidobacteriota bacterium]
MIRTEEKPLPEGAEHRILVERIRAGDAAAESELVERHGRAVRMVLAQMMRGRPEADDLFQETFRRAIEKLRAGELRQPEKLPAFMVAIARNLAIALFRLRSRRRTDEDSEVVADTAVAPADQLQQMMGDEKAVLVRRLLGELRNDRDRQLLFRFYIAEEDKESICASLGLSALHFNRVLYRARQRYRELYEQAVG